MNKTARQIILSSLLVSLLALNTVLPRLVNGQEESFSLDAVPLTVSPAREEIKIDPGQSKVVTIKFLNQGTTPVSGVVKVVDFIVESSDGSPTLIDAPSNLAPRFSAASWISLPFEKATIAGKGRLLVQARINVPKDARPGGRYAAVYFEPNNNTSLQGEALKEAITPITFRLGSLISLRIAGPINEDAVVSRLNAPQFLEYGPVPVTTEILNRGDYHIRPRGVITLSDAFGRVISQEKIDEQNVFPDSSRIFKNTLRGKALFGKYRITLNASYGDTGKVLTATVYTWVFPWRVVTAIALVILIVIILLNKFYRQTKGRQDKLEEKLAEEEKELEALREKVKGQANQ